MDSQANTHATAAAAPLEMGHLQHQQETSSSSSSSHPVAPPPEPVLSEGAPNPDQTTDYLSQPTRLLQVDEGTDPLPPTPLEMPAPALVRQETNEPIGPSTDLPTPMPSSLPSAQPSGPIITINLLLSSTGTRHPYRIDHKYLSKRGVTAENDAGDFDPFVISVYTLKELIWRDWREEWEPRPSSPSAIRLIHFGRFLDDKLPLKDCRFSDSAPNVVHMSVKPQEVLDDEENAKSAKGKSGSSGRSGSRGEGEEPTAGCRCVIL